MSEFRVIQVKSHRDVRGGLSVLDGTLPFDMKRVYWIYESDGQLRGGHRHRVTRQALVAVHGQVVVNLDDGRHQAQVTLASPSQCLIVEPEDWHTMQFGPGAVLLVIASEPFDADDYIDEGYDR
ncbi:sugar 3,4-ketoisomerase [Pandoraea bronchicola]|uniref:dTDP-6-deoxy-3,4-keto-hexulose isomerase n=1 Tax=Pandoraea bronchicola TaxID=2508287 RepID=A0A5E5BTS5_9BURK|nr:FdtA/QdtA family cupin domain-containing protein [Pandoraea bronchicola]VVE89034.1 dTDP-6-deoxy-3,4-keto-hexulose isomerase [Pandoraea bronchicola]